MSNDYAQLLQFLIIDVQKNDDNTIIANKNIELSRFSRLIAHPYTVSNIYIALYYGGLTFHLFSWYFFAGFTNL